MAAGGVESEPVGVVVGGRAEAVDDDWGRGCAVIRLDGLRFGPEALYGLEDFDRVPVEKIETGAGHPRGNPDWPLVGIFAQRAKNRPNRLGVSRCRVVKVDGLDVHVEGLDAVDGTPVLDLKPYMAEFGPRGELRQPQWATSLMCDYC